MNVPLTAKELGGYSSGGANFLTDEINVLGDFTNTGAGGFTLADNATLQIKGFVNAGTGDLSLTTINGQAIDITGALTAGGAATLNSAGAIWEKPGSAIDPNSERADSRATKGGSVTAGTLTGYSSGAVTLAGVNSISNLGAFQTNGRGSIVLDDNQALTVTGVVAAGPDNLTLQVNSGDLDVGDAGSVQGNLMILRSERGEVYGTGGVNAQSLKVTADTGIDLNGIYNFIWRGRDENGIRSRRRQPVLMRNGSFLTGSNGSSAGNP